jgi:hypothetical protein
MKIKIFITLLFVAIYTISFAQDQIINVPESTNNYTQRNQIAYAQSFDAIANLMYAYVAYTEKDLNNNSMKIVISGNKTAGTTFNLTHPSFISKCNAAATKDPSYFVHGFSIKPRPADPRVIEHRVWVDKSGNPEFLEIYIVARNPDGSAKKPVSVKVDWPE